MTTIKVSEARDKLGRLVEEAAASPMSPFSLPGNGPMQF